jgi:hypothetical protein
MVTKEMLYVSIKVIMSDSDEDPEISSGLNEKN